MLDLQPVSGCNLLVSLTTDLHICINCAFGAELDFILVYLVAAVLFVSLYMIFYLYFLHDLL